LSLSGSGGVSRVEVRVIQNIGDHRGSSFSIPSEWSRFLPVAADLHVTSLRPGHIRGNHMHRTRKEVIIVIHQDAWTLHWEDGEAAPLHQRLFSGNGAVLLTVPPGAAHAIVNSGTRELVTVGLTDAPYDPADTVKREITGNR
jgi:UDP-2-acetamido-2,6-beta-L-arabino-hexul-4-ose reductase